MILSSMQKKEIRAALDALKEIKMPKIEDKDLRNNLIDNHFTLLDAGKKVDAEVEKKRTVFLEAYKDEEQGVQEHQNKINEASTRDEQIELSKELRTKHKGYLDAVKDFNEDVNKLYKENVEGLKPIDREKFMDAIKEMDNMKLSWVEALYPLFVLEEPEKKENK